MIEKNKEQIFYQNLADSYKKMVHSLVNAYKSLEKENAILFIIAIVSLVLNIVILCKCTELTIKNKELNENIIKEHDKNIKLKSENEALWDNYYINTSNNTMNE